MEINILVTGAGGYIGGSITTELANRKGCLEASTIHAAVRSTEQARSLSGLPVSVLQLDLGDSTSIKEYVLQNKIDMVIHTATSIDKGVASNLIEALKKRQVASGKETSLIFTSGLSAFDEITGFPFGEIADNGPVFDYEKQSMSTYIVRQVDTFVLEEAEAAGVTGYLIMPPTLHGRGNGTWNQLSPQIPALIKASIEQRKVYKFAENRPGPFMHISDLSAFFVRFVEAIVRKEELPSGKQGYFFTATHFVPWWDIMERLAVLLHARGLVDDPSTEVWPNDEIAGTALGVPARFSRSMWNAGARVKCENAKRVDWQPVWDGVKLVDRLDDEIDDFLDLGMPKSSLLHSLRPKAK